MGNEEELSTHLGLKGELDFPKATPGVRLYSEGSSTPGTSESCYVDQRKLLVVSGNPCSYVPRREMPGSRRNFRT